MLVSLVIATYNRVGLLPRTLPGLMAQQLGPGVDYEVLFVDDGSTDGTRAVLEDASRQCPAIRCVSIPHTGSPARPRNVGVEAARGDVVLLVDDDVAPDPDMVQRHAAFHQQHPSDNEVALGELYLPDDVAADPMSLFHSFPYHEAAGRDRLSYLYFWTCNISLKRRFMRERGLFDEDHALHPLEDMECGYRLEQAGMHLRFLPEARGCHLHQMRPAGVPAKGRRTGQAQAALIRKVPDLALKKRFGILTSDQPLTLQALRRARRAALITVDNPLVRAALRAAGATNGRRSRASDFYYYLMFRRAVVAGFEEARVSS